MDSSFLFKIFLYFFLWIPFPLGQAKTLRVSIDPGHGGSDQGAVWGRINESDLNLKIAIKLYEKLKKDPFFDPLILRKEDKSLALPARLNMSRQFDSDLFISIHANAHKNKKVHGSEFFIQKPQVYPRLSPKKNFTNSKIQKKIEKKKSFSKTRADKIPENVRKIIFELEESNRLLQSQHLGSLIHKHWFRSSTKKIKYGSFYILKENPSPAVLVEVGYLTNPSERQKLIQNQTQGIIAQKIYKALKDYAKNIDKTPKRF